MMKVTPQGLTSAEVLKEGTPDDKIDEPAPKRLLRPDQQLVGILNQRMDLTGWQNTPGPYDIKSRLGLKGYLCIIEI